MVICTHVFHRELQSGIDSWPSFLHSWLYNRELTPSLSPRRSTQVIGGVTFYLHIFLFIDISSSFVSSSFVSLMSLVHLLVVLLVLFLVCLVRLAHLRICSFFEHCLRSIIELHPKLDNLKITYVTYELGGNGATIFNAGTWTREGVVQSENTL